MKKQGGKHLAKNTYWCPVCKEYWKAGLYVIENKKEAKRKRGSKKRY